MKLYDLKSRFTMFGEDFAACSFTNVQWKRPDETCKVCLLPIHRERIGPCTIEFEVGCDVIPDFLCSIRNDIFLVTDRVKVAFEEADLTCFVAWPLQIQEPKKVPKRPRIPRVPSPYPGPPLWDIYFTEYVHLIPDKCTLANKGVCKKCGKTRYSPIGEAEEQWFVVDRASWNGSDFMRPHELNQVFVTQRVIDVIQAGDYTNIEILQRAEMND